MNFDLRLGRELGDGSQSGPRAGDYPQPPELEFEFIDDTGAERMTIYKNDLRALQGPIPAAQWPWEQLMGVTIVLDANLGSSMQPEFLIEANFFDTPKSNPHRRSLLHDWIPVFCSVNMDHDFVHEGDTDRLSGHWLRRVLYFATAPEGPKERSCYISTHKSNLLRQAPDIMPQNPQQIEAQWKIRHELHATQAAGWMNTDTKGVKKVVPLQMAFVRYPGGPGQGFPIPRAEWDPDSNAYYEAEDSDDAGAAGTL
ncbi:hypothetical protein N7495_002719 [Penicillium taxi]|uniref:uncharacterized protein n=1 Tax=Penicillium taxi TaxID=168475 RepID=UPI002544FC31|nr:uncharacterized protein N7495_002719 [Penicillium taxi]KAJ5902191.1 hypothetical protein N7495_002719 [Penicillium taxi]